MPGNADKWAFSALRYGVWEGQQIEKPDDIIQEVSAAAICSYTTTWLLMTVHHNHC